MTSKRFPNIGFARSSLEVSYWLRLHGCLRCNERDIGTPRTNWYQDADTGHFAGLYHVTCPRCGHQRSIEFYEVANFDVPREMIGLGHLGGPEPSQIISPHLFAKELERCMAELGPDVRVDAALLKKLRAYPYEWAPLNNGKTCSVELAKFLPEGADAVPDRYFIDDEARAYRAAHHDQFARAHIEQRRRYFQELGHAISDVVKQLEAEEARPASSTSPRSLPLPPFSLAALKFHEQWVQHGDGEGRQRMIATGADARERNLSGRNLSSVLLDKVTLDRANLSYAQLQFAELTQVSAREAQWTHAGLVESTLRRCDFSGGEMTSALLHHSRIEDCNFSGATLAHTSFRKAEVSRSTLVSANLTDARLHEAVFTDCDLRGAKLGIAPGGDPPIEDATFIRCDLRDTSWRGRRLVRVHLIDCKLAGAHGAPVFEDAVIVRPDLSSSGDGTQIGDERDVTRSFAQ